MATRFQANYAPRKLQSGLKHMCGIVGAVAERNIVPILMEGLRRLEYRGYDSAGLAVLNGTDKLKRVRTVGKVKALQEALESTAYVLGGSDYCAPGQLVGDFLRGIGSTRLGEVKPSYQPGVRLGDLSQALPAYAIDALREALPAFARQIRGFDRDDAVLTGVETRTSSPVRITRDAQSLQSLNVRGLYPCGEGAGYAGGILSAGVDGIKVAEAVARSLA